MLLCIMKRLCISLPSLLLHVGHSVTLQGGWLVKRKMDKDRGAMGKRSDGKGVLGWGSLRVDRWGEQIGMGPTGGGWDQ